MATLTLTTPIASAAPVAIFKLVMLTIRASGSASISYSEHAAGGAQLGLKTIEVPAAAAKPIVEGTGTLAAKFAALMSAAMGAKAAGAASA